MPHAVFAPGNQTATIEGFQRSFIPGVAPGMGIRNIFERERTKQALLIKDAYVSILNADLNQSSNNASCTIDLKLSQEDDLTPGLLLPVATLTEGVNRITAASEYSTRPLVQNLGDRLAGTVWAPRFVGLRIGIFAWTGINVEVHLDYEVIEIPWWDWLIMWDFLDGIVDNEREY